MATAPGISPMTLPTFFAVDFQIIGLQPLPAGIMSLVLNGNDFYWQLIFYDLTSGAISVTLNDKHRAIFDLGSRSNPSNIPFISPVIGGGTLTDEQVCKLLKGKLSLVIATTLNPKGELVTRIRRKDINILRDC